VVIGECGCEPSASAENVLPSQSGGTGCVPASGSRSYGPVFANCPSPAIGQRELQSQQPVAGAMEAGHHLQGPWPVGGLVEGGMKLQVCFSQPGQIT
jgi:hypothetical protein